MANSSEIKRPKLLMFDYGGTLDTNGIHWSEVIWSQYQKENVPIDKEQFKECYVHAERELARNHIIEPDDSFLDLLRKKINIQTLYLVEKGMWSPAEVARRAVTEHISLRCNVVVQRNIDRIRPMLSELSKKYRIVLVSNFYGNLKTVLKEYGLNMFETVVESALVGIRKPDPKIYGLALEMTGVNNDEAVIIGDSLKNDITPASQLGCKSFWLQGKGWDDEKKTTDIPCQIINDLVELKNYL